MFSLSAVRWLLGPSGKGAVINYPCLTLAWGGSGIGGATHGPFTNVCCKNTKIVPSMRKNICGKAWAMIQVILFILTFHPLCPALCPGRRILWTASSTSHCSLASARIQPGGAPGRSERRGQRAAGISSPLSPCFGAVSKLLYIKYIR